MRKRALVSHLKEQLKAYPAAALMGPRQCGKTTLAKSLGDLYFDLEKEEDQVRLEATWADVVKARRLVVLDEAQNYPAVFPRLRAAIDEERKRVGRFLLLGSVSPSLMKQVGESLAGRMAICELTPFLACELPKNLETRNWILGGFPDGGIFRPTSFPDWQSHYLQLLAQRDLPLWGLPARPVVIQRFFKMLAAVHAQLWNASEIGGSLGMSYHTANSYLEYLVGAFLIRALPPFHANIRKRLVKSPRVYWRDTGLLHFLLGFSRRSLGELLSQPWVGSSWEGWIIEQLLSTLQARGQRADAWFFRTSDQKEIDLVVETRGHLWAIEIKLTSHPSPEMFRNLDQAAALIGATRRILLSRVVKPVHSGSFWSTHLRGAIEALGA